MPPTRSVLTPHPGHPCCSRGCTLLLARSPVPGSLPRRSAHGPPRLLQRLSVARSPLSEPTRGQHGRATQPQAQLHPQALSLLPLAPALPSYLLFDGDGCSPGTTIPAARPGALGTQGDRELAAQPSPQLTNPLLTLWPSPGRAKAFWQRMLGFFPQGRVMFLLLRICRCVLEGRRSEIITAPVAGSGSGSARSRQIGGFA